MKTSPLTVFCCCFVQLSSCVLQPHSWQGEISQRTSSLEHSDITQLIPGADITMNYSLGPCDLKCSQWAGSILFLLPLPGCSGVRSHVSSTRHVIVYHLTASSNLFMDKIHRISEHKPDRLTDWQCHPAPQNYHTGRMCDLTYSAQTPCLIPIALFKNHFKR